MNVRVLLLLVCVVAMVICQEGEGQTKKPKEPTLIEGEASMKTLAAEATNLKPAELITERTEKKQAPKIKRKWKKCCKCQTNGMNDEE